MFAKSRRIFSSLLLLLTAWYVLSARCGRLFLGDQAGDEVCVDDDDEDEWRRRRIYECSRREGCLLLIGRILPSSCSSPSHFSGLNGLQKTEDIIIIIGLMTMFPISSQ